MREPKVHYLGHNQTERSPRQVVFLDSETRWRDTDTGEHHSLRLWVARHIVRDGDPRQTQSEDWSTGRTGSELVHQLERWHRTQATTWIFAHNLVVELCVTRIVQELLGAGWELGEHALANDAPWARLSRGRRRIVLVDSATWLPRSIQHLGMIVKVPKPDLPENDADDTVWVDRCRADVEILGTAMEQLLDWWDRERIGCWSLTGTACGWNSYKHGPQFHRVLIDPAPDSRRFERYAVYAGRRDTWKVGHQPPGRFILIDLERAHLTAATHFALPRRRLKLRGPMPLDDWRLTEFDHDALLEVTVRTSSPRYPWRHQERVWHPVGSIRTILAGPELGDAHRRGDLVQIHGGHLYLTGMTMTEWARWLAAILDGELEDVPPAVRVWAKMCSHRVFGKWAARTSRSLEPFWSGERTWKLETGIAEPSGARCSILHLNGKARPLVHDQEADDSFPAVLSWIQSHVRLALGRLVDALDPKRLISCNTDGVLYRAAVDPDLYALARATAPFTPRIKAVYHDADILGAAHQVLDGELRLSGVPSSAEPTGESSLAWTTWPRMRRQLRLAAEEGYIREARNVDMANVPVNGWVLRDGTVKPIRCDIDAKGVTYICSPDIEDWWDGPESLAPQQNPILVPLIPH